MDPRRKSYGKAALHENEPILFEGDLELDPHPHEVHVQIDNDDPPPPQTDNHDQIPASSSSKTDNHSPKPGSSTGKTNDHSQNASQTGSSSTDKIDDHSQNASKSDNPTQEPLQIVDHIQIAVESVSSSVDQTQDPVKAENYHQNTMKGPVSTSEAEKSSKNALESTAPSSKPWTHSSQLDGASTIDPNGSNPLAELVDKCMHNAHEAGVEMSPALAFGNNLTTSNSSRSPPRSTETPFDCISTSDEDDNVKENLDDYVKFHGSEDLLIKRGSRQLHFRSKARSRLLDPHPPRQPSPEWKPGRPPLSGQFRSYTLESGPEPSGPARYGPAQSGPARSRPAQTGPVRSGPTRSGLLGYIALKSGEENDDDEDPFHDSEIPDKMKEEEIGFWGVIEWTLFIVGIVLLISFCAIPVLREIKWWSLRMWKWVVLAMVLICGRLFSKLFVRLVVLVVERSFWARKRVLYFVYGVRSAVRYCIWCSLVILTWEILFDEKTSRAPILRKVNKVLLCVLLAAVARLVKILLVKVLASSHHVTTHFDRVRNALFNHYIIESLSGQPIHRRDRTLTDVQRMQNIVTNMPANLERAIDQNAPDPTNQNTGAANRNVKGTIDFDKLDKLTSKSVSAWSMRRMVKIVRHRSLVTLDESVGGEGQGGDDSERQIHREKEAKKAAFRIFTKVATSGKKTHILLEDLKRYMKQEHAIKAMHEISGSKEKARINHKVLKNWLVKVCKERRDLTLTLNDTKTAVEQLHTLLNVIVAIFVFVLWLLILDLATAKFLGVLGTQCLLMVFMFGNTFKNVFESIVFIFVMHPFDVGDRCDIDNIQLLVEEMNIMTTVFLRYDNLIVTYPNYVLATKSICNYNRSPEMGDAIDFAIHVAILLIGQLFCWLRFVLLYVFWLVE